MSIIGISGQIGSGKDTVGRIIQHKCCESQWEIKKFAGKLKQIASLLTGIPVEKFEDQEFKKTFLSSEWGTIKDNPLNTIPVFESVQFSELMSVREFLQKLGTEAMRNGLHVNTWVNALFADYTPESKWIITDMRFPNELQAIKDRGGVTINVIRPGISPGMHESDFALVGAKFDYEIINDGCIDHLVEKVDKFIKQAL